MSEVKQILQYQNLNADLALTFEYDNVVEDEKNIEKFCSPVNTCSSYFS